jgi:hypothetical protein
MLKYNLLKCKCGEPIVRASFVKAGTCLNCKKKRWMEVYKKRKAV